MLIPSEALNTLRGDSSLSRRVNANSQPIIIIGGGRNKLIKKGEC